MKYIHCACSNNILGIRGIRRGICTHNRDYISISMNACWTPFEGYWQLESKGTNLEAKESTRKTIESGESKKEKKMGKSTKFFQKHWCPYLKTSHYSLFKLFSFFDFWTEKKRKYKKFVFYLFIILFLANINDSLNWRIMQICIQFCIFFVFCLFNSIPGACYVSTRTVFNEKV